MLTRLRLDYPPELVSRPVVAELISKFQLEVNILRAQVSRDEGWLIVELAGDSGRVAAARKWLSQEGLLVTENPDLDPAG